MFLDVKSVKMLENKWRAERSRENGGDSKISYPKSVLSKVASSAIFRAFGMTRLGIEPRSPGPLANNCVQIISIR